MIGDDLDFDEIGEMAAPEEGYKLVGLIAVYEDDVEGYSAFTTMQSESMPDDAGQMTNTQKFFINCSKMVEDYYEANIH